MCPDHQVMSVYFDGELDSPWKEKFEKHLEICPSCRKHLESYKVMRQRLKEASLVPDRPMDQTLMEAMERVWEKTGYVIRPRRHGVRRFWNGSLTIPVPIAAAAGLIMAIAFAAIIAFKQPAKVTEPPQLAGMEMQDMIPVSADMASFFQYLSSDNSADMVIIRLPETTFTNVGEPRMIRAADYTRGDGSR
ncbi:MAG: zf-HC2 domain-containing protein [Treponema sp.]|nr:zf-HC2 domain-containing protein [Treponema sp.]